MIPTIQNLDRWIEKGPEQWGTSKTRFLRTAVNQLAGARNPNEPSDLIWFRNNLENLGSRLQVSPVSVASYISRARTAIRDYELETYGPQTVFPPQPPPQQVVDGSRELTVREQISEAFIMLSRCPTLRPFLLPALVRAVAELEGGSTESPVVASPGTRKGLVSRLRRPLCRIACRYSRPNSGSHY